MFVSVCWSDLSSSQVWNVLKKTRESFKVNMLNASACRYGNGLARNNDIKILTKQFFTKDNERSSNKSAFLQNLRSQPN